MRLNDLFKAVLLEEEDHASEASTELGDGDARLFLAALLCFYLRDLTASS